jgi:hypothetical protein
VFEEFKSFAIGALVDADKNVAFVKCDDIPTLDYSAFRGPYYFIPESMFPKYCRIVLNSSARLRTDMFEIKKVSPMTKPISLGQV